jgi:hypothetical protein
MMVMLMMMMIRKHRYCVSLCEMVQFQTDKIRTAVLRFMWAREEIPAPAKPPLSAVK